MMTTAIQWTDTTWSPITGCTAVSPGCANCYAARLTATRLAHQPKYRGLAVLRDGQARFTGDVRCHDDVLDAPLHWRKPRMIFVNSMSDTFHKDVPFEFIDKLFAVMALCPQHRFQVLTKRPERMAEYLSAFMPGSTQLSNRWPLPNVWLGTSVENQEQADIRIPHLLRCPAAVRWLSCEPLLGSLDLCLRDSNREREYDYLRGVEREINPTYFHGKRPLITKATGGAPKIDWLVVGGESGPNARPCNVAWIRSLKDQCQAAGVPLFCKQLGSNVIDYGTTSAATFPENQCWPDSTKTNVHRALLRDSHGGDPSEWPEDLRVREWPKIGGINVA